MLILDKLKNLEGFTNTEKYLAHYINDHLETVITLNIEQLAERTHMFHSSIVRFAKKLGYNGFKTFKLALLEAFHSKQHTLDTIDANFPFQESDDSLEVAENISNLYINTIKRTQAQLSKKKLNDAVDLILKAKKIFLFARGDSQIRARSFQNKLMKISIFSFIAEEYADESWIAANVTDEDCAIFLSYSGETPFYDQFIQHFFDQGISTIVLTGNTNSRLKQMATVSLVSVQEELSFFKIGTFASQISFEYLLDTLFSLIYSRNYTKHLIDLTEKNELLNKGTLSHKYEKNN